MKRIRKATIISLLNSKNELHHRNLSNYTTNQSQNQVINECLTVQELNNKLQKIKNEKRISLLNKFLEENVKYDDEEYTLFTDIRKKFKEYCYNLDKNNLNNMSYNLSKNDITNYNSEFKIKYYSFCKSCNKRYRSGCCEENNRLNRSSKEVILYMKLKN